MKTPLRGACLRWFLTVNIALVWSRNFSVWYFCLFVLFFHPFNLTLMLKDISRGKHTTNGTKIFYLLHMVFIPKYLYLTSHVLCASSVSSVFCSFRWVMIKCYFGFTLKINALHAWVTRYSFLFCYYLVCVGSVWFWESSWLLSP